MKYVPSYPFIARSLNLMSVAGRVKVDLTIDELHRIIRLFLVSLDVDEEWYVLQYPQAASEIALGICQSAKDHFVQTGYFEGCAPNRVAVDDGWYKSKYADVAEGLARGDHVSAETHFFQFGYSEGRFPNMAALAQFAAICEAPTEGSTKSLTRSTE